MAYYYTPFRNGYNRKQSIAETKGCAFCDQKMMHAQSVIYPNGILVENKYYRWIINMFPKFEGHTMVVPKKHITKFGEESEKEIAAREALITLASTALTKLYPGAGVEVFIQTGEGSESSIKHLHWHVVPSQPGDPLRGFDKLGMFFTIEEAKPKILVFPVPIRKARYQLLRALTHTLADTPSKPRKVKDHESSPNGGRKRNKIGNPQRERQ